MHDDDDTIVWYINDGNQNFRSKIIISDVSNIWNLYTNDADQDGDMATVGNKGDVVVAFSDTSPTDEVLGINIFPVIHQLSSTEIYVSLEDFEEA